MPVFENGFTMKILGASGGSTNDIMALFKYDLSLVNITLEPDIADLGRYFGAIFGGAKGGWMAYVLPLPVSTRMLPTCSCTMARTR